MNPVRIVIAEDERDQREQLGRLLARYWPEAGIVASCGDGIEALAALNKLRPNVMFLDIRMPGVDGLEVARAASGRAHVVLTTAYEEYAVRAFEAGALDYLLKPVVPERLAAAIARLRERLAESGPPPIDDLLAGLREQLQSAGPERLQWITATCGDSVELMAVDEVQYFRASDKYVRVVTADKEALVRLSLKELEARLDPEHYWRVYRSVIVAAAAVDRVERDELGKWRLKLKSRDETLPVSESARALFRGM